MSRMGSRCAAIRTRRPGLPQAALASTAGRIRIRFAEARVAARSWETYSAFANEGLLPAGTPVQVLSGNEFVAGTSADQAGLARRFAATLADRGSIRLPGSEAELRLVAGSSDLLHARSFLPSADYVSIADVRVLRKADGTAFAVVVPSTQVPGSHLVPASYRVRLTYRRDNRASEPDRLVFSQAGVAVDEVTTLDVPWSSH